MTSRHTLVAIAVWGASAAAAVEQESPAVAVPDCCRDNSRSAILASTFAPFAEAASWSFTDPQGWKWEETEDGKVLKLVSHARTAPKHRSPFNLAWFDTREWLDFTLTAEVRLTKFDQGNNDLCVAFGRSGEHRFYYAHLGEKADEPHHQIHLVDNADRKPVTTSRTEGSPWRQGKWHRIRVVRNANTGDIGVWFDDSEQPVLTAKDKTLGWGKIGLGSFDDLGEFRKVSVRGKSRPAR